MTKCLETQKLLAIRNSISIIIISILFTLLVICNSISIIIIVQMIRDSIAIIIIIIIEMIRNSISIRVNFREKKYGLGNPHRHRLEI